MMRAIAVATLMVVVAISSLAAAAAGAGENGSSGGFVKPVDHATVSLGFGCTDLTFEPINRACPGGHWHSGVDLAAGLGTPVQAAAAGSALVMHTSGGFGLFVIVDHGGGLSSLYGHLSSVSVHSGDAVSDGEIIGAVGSTGNSTGPHLHFEIRRDGIPEDPRTELALP